MRALEPMQGVRVVARPDALDAAQWSGDDVRVIRVAPDEAFGIGATGAELPGDSDAIVEAEGGFSVARLEPDQVAVLASHLEWTLPSALGALAQGKLDGVPVKLLTDEPALLVVQTAYVDELAERLR